MFIYSYNKKTMKTLAVIFLAFFSSALFGQATAGTVDISVTSKPNDVDYSPRHVLAIWIEDGSGDFVQTLKLDADNRKQYLYTWNTKSSGNTTDAITGSTLSSHKTHDVSWDCTNNSGTLVDDGDYSVRVEYTSEHAQGPLTTIAFTKTVDEFTFQPSDETYFVDMDLVYTPESTTGIEEKDLSYHLSVYPVPVTDQLHIEMFVPADQKSSIKIYQSDMKLVKIMNDSELVSGEHSFIWDLSNEGGAKVPAGTYFLVVSGTNTFSSRQIIVQ